MQLILNEDNPINSGSLNILCQLLCDSIRLSTGITCVQTSFLDYKCVCPPGFTGPKCGERFDVCASNPCLNGDCVAPFPGTYRCSCKPGFKGRFCEESVFICDFRTCLNGGYCVGNANVSLDFSTCVCPNGYTGKYCEAVIDPCLTLTKPCGDNGKCYYSAPGQYVCRVRFDLINKDLINKHLIQRSLIASFFVIGSSDYRGKSLRIFFQRLFI